MGTGTEAACPGMVAPEARQYNWASQGRSSEAAAWHPSILDEAATADGLTSGTTFMDLAKAFETVSLEQVWRAGLKHGFPLQVLALMLEAFAFARQLSYQGAVSEAVITLSAILAGGGFAQVALFLVLIDPLDDIQVRYTTGVTVCLLLAPLSRIVRTICYYVSHLPVAPEHDNKQAGRNPAQPAGKSNNSTRPTPSN